MHYAPGRSSLKLLTLAPLVATGRRPGVWLDTLYNPQHTHKLYEKHVHIIHAIIIVYVM